MNTSRIGLALLSLGVVSLASAKGIAWETNFDHALKLAKKTHRAMVVDFYTEGCSPCVKLEKQTYTDANVIKFFKNVIPVKLNADIPANMRVADHYGVSIAPTIFVLNPKGKYRFGFVGFKAPGAFVDAIRPYIHRN